MMMDMNKRKIEPYRDTKPANSGRSLTCLGKSQMPVIGKLSGIGSEPSELKPRSNVFRLQTEIDLQYDPVRETLSTAPYRDAICELCEKTVSLALSVPLAGIQANSRCNAETALARQIAMYLCHTTFSLLLTEVGLHFGRDRTTVSHACSLIEDKRDDLSFDVMVCQLESLLCDARHAMSFCLERNSKGEVCND